MTAGYTLHDALRRWLDVRIKGEDRTLAKVARAIGVSQERLHHWTTGRNRVPLDKLTDIARYFQLGDESALIADVRRLYPAPALTRVATPPRAPALPKPAPTPAVLPELSETRELVGEFVRESGLTKKQSPRRPPARQATARKRHGTHGDA